MNDRVSRYIGLHDKEVAPWTKGDDLGDVSWQSLMYKPMKDDIENILATVKEKAEKAEEEKDMQQSG